MNKQVEQIKAEIERLKKWCEEHTTESYSCYFDAFNDIDTFINSLEEESVSEDLEKAAIRIADEILPIAGREIWHGETEKNIERRKQIREGVKRGANWQKEALLDKVCEWLKDNLPYCANPPCQVIDDLRKSLFNID